MKFYAQIDFQNKIIPLTDFDYDIFKKIKKNKEISIEIKQERNAKFHRKFFVLLNLVFENQDKTNNIDDLREDLTIASGYYREKLNTITGEVEIKPKSISFSQMDNAEFEVFYNSFLDTINRYFGMDKKELLEIIEQYF